MVNEDKSSAPPKFQHANQTALRRQIVASFHDENVHGGFKRIFAGIPSGLRGTKPAGQPFTLWRILEHLRLCVLDFLNCCTVPGYVEPPFPAGYWPQSDFPEEGEWDASLAGFRSAMESLESLLLDPSTDLFAEIPGSDGRTILRQAFACLDHNSYHLGEAVLLRRLLGIWETT